MTNKTRHKIDAKIPFFVFKEGENFVAYSPALDLSTCGDTEKEARKMFAEAARIFLDEIVRMGTVADVLTELGWKQVTPEMSWSPPTYKQDFVQIAQGAY